MLILAIVLTSVISRVLSMAGGMNLMGVFGFFLSSVTTDLPGWVYPAAVGAALLGNWAGKQVVERITDEHFKTLGRVVILVIGAGCLAKGIHETI